MPPAETDYCSWLLRRLFVARCPYFGVGNFCRTGAALAAAVVLADAVVATEELADCMAASSDWRYFGELI